MPPPSRPAYSLAEVVVVLTLSAVLLTLAAPRFAALRDGASVRAAADEAGRAFAMARAMSVARRSAVSVAIDTAGGALELRTLGHVVLRRELRGSYRVALATNRDSMVYDARGIGYGASNLSVVIKRGRAVDTVVVSRLGRVRW